MMVTGCGGRRLDRSSLARSTGLPRSVPDNRPHPIDNTYPHTAVPLDRSLNSAPPPAAPAPAVAFPCTFCGRRIGVAAELVGRLARCPRCRQVILVPLTAVPRGVVPTPAPAPARPVVPPPAPPRPAVPPPVPPKPARPPLSMQQPPSSH